MDNIGIAFILEKKEIIIDGKKEIYYEAIDAAIGIYCCFKNGYEFVSLSHNELGRTLSTTYNSNDKYFAGVFQSFYHMSSINNNTLDIEKFMDFYREGVGLYFTYDRIKNIFYPLTDEYIYQCIKERNKDFNENDLDKDTDISKMYAEIKKTIINQDEQIMKILTSLFKNQKVINSDLDNDMKVKLKENILIYGSTGTGKTEILKRISKIYNIPIVIEDATSLSETGYVGRNITDMLNDLYLAAGKDIELAEKGILVIDEFDKLAERRDNGKDSVSRTGVQRSLLKLLDGSEFYFENIKFNTSKLSVVALGAFTDMIKDDDYSNVTTTTFVEYGIIRELMGRFSKFVSMNTLTKDDIKRILVESNFSPLNTYKKLFQSMNIEFSYDEDFLDYVAEKAVELNSGARSLKIVFDDMISSAMFRIFAGDYTSIHLSKPNNNQKTYVLTKKN